MDHPRIMTNGEYDMPLDLAHAARSHRRPGLLRRIGLMFGLARQRHALKQLDERLLDDIGLLPDEARAEAARPVWDVPRTWLR